MLGNFLVIIRKERAALISVMHDLFAKELLGAGEEPGEAGYAHITVRTAVDEPFMKSYFICRTSDIFGLSSRFTSRIILP